MALLWSLDIELHCMLFVLHLAIWWHSNKLYFSIIPINLKDYTALTLSFTHTGKLLTYLETELMCLALHSSKIMTKNSENTDT